MKGVYTINIENIDTGEVKKIVKENAINPVAKRYAHPESCFEVLAIAPEDELPVVDSSGNITISENLMFKSGIGSSYSFPTPLYSVYGLDYVSLSKGDGYFNSEGGVVYEYTTSYIEGEFVLGGILIYSNEATQFAHDGSVRVNRIMSALNVDPVMNIFSNERVYFHYKLIKEWY